MTIARRKPRDVRRRVLREAEELVTQKIADNSVEELTRTGIVWGGILDLESGIPPTEVAAMLSAYDLVRATKYVDSEEYWTSAAAYAALGAYSEPSGDGEQKIYDDAEEDKKAPLIGFAPGHTKLST